MKEFLGRFRLSGLLLCMVVSLMMTGLFAQSAVALPLRSHTLQPIIAYNIDFGMDLARAEQTIEYYGEEIREIVEKALRNNENNPERKETAQNSYRRESVLNDLLPEARSSAFSESDLVQMKKTDHPRDRLR